MTARPWRPTAQQRATLRALLDHHELGADPLADLVGTHRHGVGRTASGLVRRGLLTRGRADGRVLYRLTEAGRAQAEALGSAFGAQ